ncbi:MAG TPA: hypothetical protein PKI62_06865 [bacterium]|nr:hypothetical protein [bacterium]HPR86920.1 hypothetical protein [bacterium]
MLIFEKAVIKKYWPADDKGADDLIVRQVQMQVEAEIEDSDQIRELYKNMVRGLVHLAIMDNLTGEEYELAAVTIRPFTIKQKKITLGKGETAETVKQEFAVLTLVCKAKDDDGATMLADLYRFFNIEVQLNFSEFRFAGGGTSPADEEETAEE